MAKVIEQGELFGQSLNISINEDRKFQRDFIILNQVDNHNIIEKSKAREVSLAIFDWILFINWINENEYRYSRKYKMYQRQFINETLFYSTEELLQIYLTHLNK